MLEWLSSNAPSVIAAAVIAIILALAVRSKLKKRGSCGCGCPGCTGSCPTANVKKN